MKMNLPNKLTLMRVILIPFYIAVIVFPIFEDTTMRIVASAIFAVTSLTDFLDGQIARKYGLVTDFGKFLDPVADKLMILGAFVALLTTVRNDDALFKTLVWATFIVILREISVTSLRMIVRGNAKLVISANWPGKVKTVAQIVCVFVLLLEPVLFGNTVMGQKHVLSYVSMGAMAFMTVLSGIIYFKDYWKYLDPHK